MLPQTHAPDLSAGSGPGQSFCSADTGDVLVRSTRVQLCDRRHEPGLGPELVQLTVQKLPDPFPVRCLSTRTENEQRPKQRQAPDKGAVVAELQAGIRRALLKNPGAIKENRQPPTELSPDMKLCAKTDSGSDLLTSCFATGGRGDVLAALRQRSLSALHRREVNVQLSDPSMQDDAGLRISPQDAPHQGTSSQSAVGVAALTTAPDATHAAAVAAATAVCAAAPLIKAQSDMETRVSQLMDKIEKLLQADRDTDGTREDFNQQTLKHLERLHSQQLQLQSWLRESALQVVTDHAPIASVSSELTVGDQLDHLHVRDTAVNALCRKKQTTSATRAASATAMETGTVAMVTPQGNGWTEQTRQSWSKQEEPSVSRAAAHKAEGPGPQPAASNGREVERTASEALREMGRLKALLTPEDMRMTSENLWPQESCSHPDQNQALSQRLQSCHSVFQLCQNQSQPNPVQPQLSQYHQQQPNQNHSQPAHPHSRRFQSHQSPLQEIQSKHSDSQQAQSQQAQNQSVPVQRRPLVPSTLEEAGQVLRQVRRQRKVLEENLEALLRANRGEVLYCQLEALADNRDWTNKVRIKKTVDAWISALTNDTQTDQSQRGAAVNSHPPARRSPMSTSRGTGIKAVVGRGGRAQTDVSKQVQGAEPDQGTGVMKGKQLEGESYLTRLYGRAPHEGLRRTLKKSPYLRFSSPASVLGGKARPRLVERVQGVKVKSCKTQTMAQSAVGQQQHSFSAAHMKSSGATDVQSVPVAVPLGRRRVEVSSRSRHAPPSTSVVATDNGAPEQQSQNKSDAGEAPPSHSVYIIERKSEEEDDVFPGSDLESVTHVQVAIELDPEPPPPPPVLYRGPPFPPQPLSALPAPDPVPVLGLDRQRDVLENRLVEWMEQQLMSRMISEMYTPTAFDPVHNVSPGPSESDEQGVASDIVEAAGGAGLQLFVDSNIEVDSALIRQLVSEVLTETVSLLLGQRDLRHTDPELAQAAAQEKLVLLVPTPVPTPPPSPVPFVREGTPLTTPPPSEPISQLNNKPLQPVTASEHITPTSSPEPTPPAVLRAPPPLTWGNTELPLDEEQPEAPLDTLSPPLVMSVAEEEPPLSSPDPPPLPSVPPAAPSPPPDPGPLSLSGSSEDSSSSSSAVTEAALKHISEGELLISVNLQAALTENETACSYSSSMQDMDFDPPSEGQVKGQDLQLLTKMEQQLSHQGERPQPEGSWGREEELSVGEVRDNWTTEPSRTTNPSNGTSAQQDATTSSPGQTSQCADVSDVSFDSTNQGLVSMGGLMVEPVNTLTFNLQTELSLSPHPPHLLNAHTAAQVVPIQVKRISRRTEPDLQPGGTRKMDVHLPFIRTEQEESVSSAQTSSTNDVF
ncbi:protein TALPID3 isoform X5 [Betta splendens]|uniref:Protein TALPID3 isoform X5 n=1 Tax=Betta splendens TaxID=158456 RepID=A0A9W2XIE1_BETSP|nr:protein TALPID3 isoform X5 [Betta splendens]